MKKIPIFSFEILSFFFFFKFQTLSISSCGKLNVIESLKTGLNVLVSVWVRCFSTVRERISNDAFMDGSENEMKRNEIHLKIFFALNFSLRGSADPYGGFKPQAFRIKTFRRPAVGKYESVN